jgi:DNA-binding NtrC family response regulator
LEFLTKRKINFVEEEIMSKILLVDDYSSTREGMKLLLTAQGYQVTCACSLVQAVEALSKERVAVVLTDLTMAHPMDGVSVLIESKRWYPTVPVICMTGAATMPAISHESKGIKYEFAGVIPKPVNVSMLVDMVRRVVH